MTYFVYDIALLLFVASSSSSFTSSVLFSGVFETKFTSTLAPSPWDHMVTINAAQPSALNLQQSNIGHKAKRQYRRDNQTPSLDGPRDNQTPSLDGPRDHQTPSLDGPLNPNDPENSPPMVFTTRLMPGQHFTHKYLITTTRRRRQTRTMPKRHSFLEDCDVLAFYCMKSYNTGKLCGRTNYYNYFEFKNYCQMDYINCMERYDVWQVVHMGECFEYKAQHDNYQHYPYWDDYFLDTYYLMEDQV